MTCTSPGAHQEFDVSRSGRRPDSFLCGIHTRIRRGAAGATRQPFTFYLAAGVLYLAITTLSVLALRALEQRVSRGVRVAAL